MDFATYMRTARTRLPEVDKIDFIRDRVVGRSVLDIGCVDNSVAFANRVGDRWLHGIVVDVANHAVGIDTKEAAVEVMVNRGYDMRVGDAQDLDLGQVFHVVVAGDIVEHLTNVGGFLDGVRRHMDNHSEFVLTTPNPFNIEQTTKMLFGKTAGVSVEHTAWFDPIVAYRALERHGFEVTEFAWLATDYPQMPNRSLRAVAEVIMRWRPLLRRDFGVVARRAATSMLPS